MLNYWIFYCAIGLSINNAINDNCRKYTVSSCKITNSATSPIFFRM